MNLSRRPKNHDNHRVSRENRWTRWIREGLPADIGPRLVATQRYTPAAADRVAELADQLDRLLERHPAHIAVDRFLAAATTWPDRIERRACIAVLEVLGDVRAVPLEWPGWLPPADVPRKRVLHDIEMGLLRSHTALYDVRRVITMALLEAGAVSGELALVLPDMVDGHRVHLPGRRGIAPRTVTILPWAREALASLLTIAPAGQPIVYTGAQTDPADIQSSVLVNFEKPMTQSGLKADPTVAPMSIRHTGLRAIHDEHGWDACVAAAGMRSWDRLRRDIGLL